MERRIGVSRQIRKPTTQECAFMPVCVKKKKENARL
jgi:hypothetical protein